MVVGVCKVILNIEAFSLKEKASVYCGKIKIKI